MRDLGFDLFVVSGFIGVRLEGGCYVYVCVRGWCWR